MEPDIHYLVADLTQRLQKAQIAFFFTGGLASIFYGEPRTTQDIDLVIRLTSQEMAQHLYLALEPAYFVDAELLHEAWAERSLGQALHKTQFTKIDLHFGELVPGEFDRVQQVEMFSGTLIPLLSREDAILSKLLWIRLGSHRSRRDVVGMLRHTAPINQAMLDDIARQLDVFDLLQELRILAAGSETQL